MTDDLRWAVRYAFLEDLWRDRPRVVVDAGLEAALREAPRGRGGQGPLDALVDALVPRVSKARTWMAVADEAVARELAQTRPGTGFLPRGSFADVVEHRDWAVALVELSALHDDAPGGPRLREVLVQRAQEGRTVIVSARSAPGEEDEDAGFAALSELVEDELGGGRIFGVARPPMAAVIDFGADEEEERDEDEDVPLSFDNTLGSQSPAFVEYVAVAGRVPPLPEGMTLVELPADAPSVDQSSDGALRAQLVQAQRQAELAAIDRQALLEKVDALESVQARLEQQAAELRDHLARAVTEEAPHAAEAAQRLQAALAENQALRWKVQQLEREIEAVKARPVEVLEAEVAMLRATLAAHEAAADEAAADEAAANEAAADGGEDDGAGDGAGDDAWAQADGEQTGFGDEAPEELGEEEAERPLRTGERGELLLLATEAEDAALRIRYRSALVDLDRLIHRVERGGIGAVQLRQALVGLRRRLRS
jgi:regulator of replication initiation timing